MCYNWRARQIMDKLSLSFRVMSHSQRLVYDVEVIDTVLECITSRERLTLRGKIGNLGDKIDMLGDLAPQQGN